MPGSAVFFLGIHAEAQWPAAPLVVSRFFSIFTYIPQTFTLLYYSDNSFHVVFHYSNICCTIVLIRSAASSSWMNLASSSDCSWCQSSALEQVADQFGLPGAHGSAGGVPGPANSHKHSQIERETHFLAEPAPSSDSCTGDPGSSILHKPSMLNLLRRCVILTA